MREPRQQSPSSANGRDPFDLIEPYLDDELSTRDRRLVDERLRQDPELVQALDLARRIQVGLREMPAQACPPQVTNKVLSHTERTWQHRLRTSLDSFGLRPTRLVAGFALLVIALVSHQILLDHEPPTDPGHTSVMPVAVQEPTPQEVAQAEEDVKLALAYLGKLGRTAGNSVMRMTRDQATRVGSPSP